MQYYLNIPQSAIVIYQAPPDIPKTHKPALIYGAIYDKRFIIRQHILFVSAPEYIFQ